MTKKSKRSKIKAKSSKTKKSNVVAAEQTGYCMKCQTQRVIANAKRVMMGKNKDRPAMKGECPECGTGMFRFLKKDAA